MLRVAVVVVLVVAVAVAGIVAGRASISSPGSSLFGGSGSGARATSGLAARVDPGLVDVDSQLGLLQMGAAGTGMVLTSSGEVLTNNHVVEGATSVSVTDVGNGHSYAATVVGTDKSADVAVLRLTGASGLTTVEIGDSSKVTDGQAVTAIGNAGGTGGTPSVTTGNVTALDQSITASDDIDNSDEQLSGLIETDATLQPGDSGGPLVDNNGRVVGMDTAASEGFQFQSGSEQSYAIPINEATSIARQIVAGEGSAAVHIGPAALLGVEVADSQSQCNGRSGGTPVSGALVCEAIAGDPAARAGIVAGDVIDSIGGQTVSSADALTNLMYVHHPGDSVKVEWADTSGQQHSAIVHLTAGPAA